MTTWKEFKELVEAAGVKDDSAISYIDISGTYEVTIEQNKSGDSWCIWD
jgi:hypothetical protein